MALCRTFFLGLAWKNCYRAISTQRLQIIQAEEDVATLCAGDGTGGARIPIVLQPPERSLSGPRFALNFGSTHSS